MRRGGLTLLELLVVLTILIALATIVVPVIGGYGTKSQQIGARENLQRLQDLLVNQYQADMGELPRPSPATVAAGTRPDHPQLRYLFLNPDTEDITSTSTATLLSGRIWRGPYVLSRGSRYVVNTTNNFTTVYGIGDVLDGSGNLTTPGDPTVVHAWGHPIVIQVPNTTGGATPSATDITYTRLVCAGPNGVIDTSETIDMPTAAQRGDDIVLFLYRADQYGDSFLNLGP